MAIPKSVMASGYIRRMFRAGTNESRELIKQIEWTKYLCGVRGVRWHPSGSWRVQFKRRCYEHNYFVNCSCYFRVGQWGFDRAKEMAIGYRRRLEYEWAEVQEAWKVIDHERETARLKKREARRVAELEAQELMDHDGDADGLLIGGEE
ncbi:conserved hypothetical protein [Perkinsus marinus ATCC 50983]|uniref:AP2/ERF domain-containing protein n=1 Tax=Perkinsus marinus (strain ATCC 50983 / TXsc) TaxID=423536 RepID=C5KEH2_PERM5|nr:conserved hypothetical protein [Perkinsus marinus ATCC 50983]EER17110.1 conserved hypothetical protein [Perkinsus marinus ATCC 50983]|eukprot:XP_002785314.1 conserved hypothetical protein [Perkinsus marinus ATCC 50983]